MSSLFALLDDVAALAKVAAASVDDVGAAAGRASAKAVGVVVDDTAVTPRYVQGIAAERELPIIKKIAIGSLRNKLLIILPIALLLSQFLPAGINWLLIAGGTYLSFEGAEKIYEALFHRGHHEDEAEVTGEMTPEREKEIVGGAVRTDLILSAEIMAISLASVADEPLLQRALILIIVAFVITTLVYGVVALIVKMDDVGMALAGRNASLAQRVGRGMVKAMPRVMTVLSAVGTAAMLWVGGHIIIAQADGLGWHGPASILHHLEHGASHALPHAVQGTAAWLVETFGSAVFGLVVGGVVVALVQAVSRLRSRA